MQKRESVQPLAMSLIIELENKIATLKSKIALLEVQLESERQRIRQIQLERDNAIQRLSVMQRENHQLKTENTALRTAVADVPKFPVDHTGQAHLQGTERLKDPQTKKAILVQGKDGRRQTEAQKENGVIQVSDFVICVIYS